MVHQFRQRIGCPSLSSFACQSKAALIALLACCVLITSGCDDDTDAPAVSSSDASMVTDAGAEDSGLMEAEQSPLELAVEAIGGAEALTALSLLRIEASGTRRIDYEGMVPSDIHDASTYTSTYLYDLATADVRVDMTRTALFEAFAFFPVETYSVVLKGDVGGLTAQAGFYPAGALPSQHVGALRQQQRLLNPHVLLLAALADASIVGDGGEEDYDGRAHRIVTIMENGAEARLFVDAQTGVLSKLETLENSPLLRDVPLEVRYMNWQPHGALSFPGTVELYAVEGLVHQEVRSAVTVEPADVAADAFDLPAEAGGAQANADALAFGRQSHQVIEAFFHILFGYDPGGAPQVSELAPGVVLLGSGHNSVAVVVDDALVVLEGAQSPAHGTQIVETLQGEFPGMPISHLIQSHHHQDHSAGVRSFVAAGATVVIGPGVRAFYEQVFAAPSTLRPDALSQSDVVASIQEVAENDTSVIAGGGVTVTAYHVSANPHAADMLVTVIDTGDARFVYVADLYNAGAGFTAVVGGPEAFMAALRDLSIIDAACASAVPMTIISSHGTAQSLEDSIAELVGLGADIGCP